MSGSASPEAVVLVGVQASGKSTFVRERLFDTHVRVNLDMLRTRRRESLIVEACIAAKQSFVVDNTNPTPADRARYVVPARDAGFTLTCFYFRSAIGEALSRNALRTGRARVPESGVRATHARLELPSTDEGFDALHYVTMQEGGGFVVQEWAP